MIILKKYKYISFFIFLSFLLLSVSCKKLRLNETTVSGIVINSITQEPIPNANVYVLETKSTDLLSKYEYEEFHSQTDDDGKYSIDFKAGGNRYTYEINVDDLDKEKIYANSLDYYFSDNLYGTIGNQNIEKNTTNYIILKVAPIGFFFLEINNVSPYDDNDKITIRQTHEISGIFDIEFTLNGNDYIYFSYMYPRRPEGNYTLTWTVTKNNVTETYIDTFTIAQNQSTNYTINY